MIRNALAALTALLVLSASPALAQSKVEVAITSNGLEQKSISVPPSGELTFVNRDSQPHQIDSDPHPVHNSCPWLNGRRLAPGESYTAHAPASGRCTFHDHLHPSNPALHGSVAIG